MTRAPVDTTCKSCRHYARESDALLYSRHVAVGLGHCKFDLARGMSLMRPNWHTCDRYDATDRRKAYLAAMAAMEAT